MVPHPIGIAISRIAAIWLAVNGLTGMVLVFTSLLEDVREFDSLFFYSISTALAPLVSAFILWHYAENISSTRFPVQQRNSTESQDSNKLFAVGLQLLGIWILIMGIVGLIQTETVAWMQFGLFSDNETFAESLTPHTIGGRVSNAIQIVLGIALIWRGKRAVDD